MKAIVIGASSGGPSTLEYILSKLPKDLDAYIVIVQHLPKKFTGSMAKRFDENFELHIKELENGEALQKSTAYIVPGGHHFFLVQPSMQAVLIDAEDSNVPSIDMGFTSVAEHFGPDTTGIILTGMGSDGVLGTKAIKQLGGHVIAQDETTSLVYGMPFEVKLAGFADEILPLKKIPERIIEIAKND